LYNDKDQKCTLLPLEALSRYPPPHQTGGAAAGHLTVDASPNTNQNQNQHELQSEEEEEGEVVEEDS